MLLVVIDYCRKGGVSKNGMARRLSDLRRIWQADTRHLEQTPFPYKATVGIDWADRKHDVFVRFAKGDSYRRKIDSRPEAIQEGRVNPKATIGPETTSGISEISNAYGITQDFQATICRRSQ